MHRHSDVTAATTAIYINHVLSLIELMSKHAPDGTSSRGNQHTPPYSCICSSIERATADEARANAACERIKFFSNPRGSSGGPYGGRLSADVLEFSARLRKEDGEVDTVTLATRLAAVGYNVAVRQAHIHMSNPIRLEGPWS